MSQQTLAKQEALEKKYQIKELRDTMRHAYAWVSSCIRCTTCASYYPPGKYEDIQIRVCPSYYRYNYTAYAGGGKMMLLRLIHENELDWNADGLMDVLYRCTTCGNCSEICYTQAWRTKRFNMVRLIELMRAELVARGIMKPEHKAFIERLEKHHNPYGEKHESRFLWLPKEVKVSGKADTVYFVGCTAAYRRPEIAKATTKILNKASVEFMTLSPEEWCCGSPALRVGKRELFAEIAKHNSEAIKKAGIKRIVTSCAGCYRTLKIDYPEFVGKLPVEIVHTSELLANLIKDGRLKLKGVISETVTYHDPCHLGRHCGVYEPPRDVLKSIQGITYVELPRNRQSAWCCGAGGGVKSGYPDFALWTAKDRLKEVEVAGAKALVSTCPFCATNFKDTIKDTTSKLKFYDLTELVLKALQ